MRCVVTCFNQPGWDLDAWNVPAMKPLKDVGIADLDLVQNMSGNAYSLFQFGPWVMAAMCTYGKFASSRAAASSPVASPALPEESDGDIDDFGDISS